MLALKHNILLDQLTLEHWIGKKLDTARIEEENGDGKDLDRYLSHAFDVVDGVLVSFIADMNAQDEAVRRLMYRGHFLLTLAYIAERLPILQMDERGIYRRLRWLKMMGILSCEHRTVDGSKSLAYYRCSDLYWKIREKRHAEAVRAARLVKEKAIAPAGHGSAKAIAPAGRSHSPCGLASLSNEAISTPTAPPPAEAASGAAPPAGPAAVEEAKTGPAPEPELDIDAELACLPWKKGISPSDKVRIGLIQPPKKPERRRFEKEFAPPAECAPQGEADLVAIRGAGIHAPEAEEVVNA